MVEVLCRSRGKCCSLVHQTCCFVLGVCAVVLIGGAGFVLLVDVLSGNSDRGVAGDRRLRLGAGCRRGLVRRGRRL